MNQNSRAFRHSSLRRIRATHPIGKGIVTTLAISVLGVLSACSNVSNLAKERVAQSETWVQQSQQTVGKSEHGAVELQQAREKLSAAQGALSKGQEKEAERSAAQAHLYAELAVAKSQSADARKAANEVLASLDMLRQETERTTPIQR
jgi:hypothetical protein